MRITAFLLLIGALHVHARGYGQRINLSEKDAPLTQVFRKIEEQSGFSFLYNDQTLQRAAKVTLTLKNSTLEEALAACFRDQPLSYTVDGKTIIVKPLVHLPPAAETPTDPPVVLRGHVTDSAGNAMQGVTVALYRKGKVQSFALTDDKGDFDMSVQQGDKLVFSHVGFQSYSVVLEKESHLDVRLHPAASQLSSIEVTIDNGYQKILPEQSTGAVSQIATKQYESQININFLAGLQGKLPGLLINNDIQFNGNNLFQVRGLSTISAGSQPLIVLDGYPTSLSLNDINPNEIKSVTLLKDAAAAAIYGVKASNGVLVVERKEATRGAPQFAFRATTAFTPRENYNSYRWSPSNTYLNYIRSVYKDGDPVANPLGFFAWAEIQAGYSLPYGTDIIYQRAAGLITEDQLQQKFARLGSYNNTSEYQRLLLRTATTQSYNLDISGGSDKATYYVTGAYTGSKSNQIENGNYQIQLASRTNFNFTSRLSLQLIDEFNESHTNSAPVPSIYSIYPYEHLQDAQGTPLPIFAGSGTTNYYLPTLLAEGLEDPMYYPLTEVHAVTEKTHVLDNRFTGNFTYKIGHGLNFLFGGVYETSRTDERYYASEQSSIARNIIDYYAAAPAAAGGPLQLQVPKGGYLQQSASGLTNYTVRAQMDYKKYIGSDHFISAIAGAEVDRTTTQSNTSSSLGYNDQTLLQQPVNYANLFSAAQNHDYLPSGGNGALVFNNLFNQGYVDNRFVSGYANALYSYRSRYSLTGSIRVDQSNLFGTDPKYRYKPLWSTGFAWNIAKEKFMESVNWVHALKLRLSEGFDGNVAKNSIPQVIARAALNPATSPPNAPALALSSPANPGLRWEETRNFNVGLDWTIFKGLSGSIDYYVKNSTNLLAPAGNLIDPTLGTGRLGEVAPNSNGIPQSYINSASINNHGLEINLNADWITRHRFNWYTGFALSVNTNKVVSVYNTATSQSSSAAWVASTFNGYIQGYSAGPLLSYRFAGLDNTGLPEIYDQNGKIVTSPGVTGTDGGKSWLVYSGTSIPAYTLGMSNRVDIGPFYVYCMVNYYGGFRVRVPRPFPSDARSLAGAQDFWKQPGDEKNTDVWNPSIPFASSPESYAYQYSDRYVVNGSYLTLSAFTLSYDLGHRDFMKKLGLNHFELLLQGNNLYTVGFNKYDFSQATQNYAKRNLTPTYTIGLYTNF